MHLGNWQLDTVNGGDFCLDGGVVFGVVPKTIWSKAVKADELNRVQLANHCVLARDGQQTVLVDAGYGTRFDSLERRFYAMDAGSPLQQSLAELGVSVEDVDTVVFSHLHFDHLCGAIQCDARNHLVPTFPNARYVVGRIEWEVAISQAAEVRGTYPASDIAALREMTKVTLVEDGATVVPGLWSRLTGGHTRGHLSLLFKSGGETAIYPGDFCPSTFHLRQMWHLAYDLYPIETRRRKPQVLGEAADHSWWLLWNHDPTAAASRIARDARREFISVDVRAAL